MSNWIGIEVSKCYWEGRKVTNGKGLEVGKWVGSAVSKWVGTEVSKWVEVLNW